MELKEIKGIKTGDIIIITKGDVLETKNLEGKKLRVISVQKYSLYVKHDDVTVKLTSECEIRLYTRKDTAEEIKAELEVLKARHAEEVKTLENKIERLEKYDSDEEYEAFMDAQRIKKYINAK